MRAIRHRGFTLIEILVVLGIMALVFGSVVLTPTGQEDEAQVRGAAEQLAAVLRETRARAIRQNAFYGVAFHIQNAPGSSGRILNNRSGGHYYRVLGTAANDSSWGGLPLYRYGGASYESWSELVARSWVSDPYRLPQGKVRFLALTDQDNGNNAAPASGGFYAPTYPRPWFGWWDEATGRLYAWGGYDPDLKADGQEYDGYARRSQTTHVVNGRQTSASGFYYEGWEGEITGCINPRDREVNSNYIISKAGEPRPLINADWLDYLIIFRPDGTVDTDWFRARHGHWEVNGFHTTLRNPYTVSYSGTFRAPGLADRCNAEHDKPNWDDYTATELDESDYQREATDYVDRTGYHWITLAGDAVTTIGAAEGVFDSARAARRSLGPIYRVGVSPDGNVTVVRVGRSDQDGRTFDTTITGDDWEDKNKIWGKTGTRWSSDVPITAPNYVNHRLHNADGTPRGEPVVDLVTPEMMRDRKWWWETP